MTEAQLLARIEAMCRRYHVWCQHIYNPRGSRPGWVDLELVGTRILHRELKVKDRQPSDAQVIVLTRLAFAGADVRIWRETDLLNGRIEAEIAAIAAEPLHSERELPDWEAA